jgi:hypothetical protein
MRLVQRLAQFALVLAGLLVALSIIVYFTVPVIQPCSLTTRPFAYLLHLITISNQP